MRVLILANGDPPTAAVARSAAARHDLLIATDGAAHSAATLGLTPDIICGDFDSIDLDAAQAQFPNAEFTKLFNQNLADLEKAILLAIERGSEAITILGACGGRVDHSLATMALLVRYHSEIAVSLEHDRSAVRVVSGAISSPGRLNLATKSQDTVSLVAFSPTESVSITGVEWPLLQAPLPVGTQGVSNVALGDRVDIEVHSGCVIVCHLWDVNR